MADAKKTLEGSDAGAMKAALEKLTSASHKLAEAMYKAQATPPPTDGAGPQASAGGSTNGAAGAGQEKKKDEGVIDAEYVDVEPKN